MSGAACVCNGTSIVLWGAKTAALLSLFFDRVIGIYGGIEMLEVAPPESTYAHRMSIAVASILGIGYHALQRILLRLLLAWITVSLVNKSIERQLVGA